MKRGDGEVGFFGRSVKGCISLVRSRDSIFTTFSWLPVFYLLSYLWLGVCLGLFAYEERVDMLILQAMRVNNIC